MQTQTQFYFTLDREEDGTVEVAVTAQGEIDFMGDGFEYVDLSVTDEDDKPVTLTEAEDRKITQRAEELLMDELDNHEEGY
jgi:hypothetical protein